MMNDFPPYQGVIGEYSSRAEAMHGGFAERFARVNEILYAGGECDAVTVCFTHPKLNRLKYSIYLGTAYPAAIEAASLSGEVATSSYYGRMKDFNFPSFSKSDLEKSLNGSNSVWFITGDKANTDTGEYDGYNHMVGIVPDPYSDGYVAMDVSGYINPLVPLTLDELHDEISRLPVGNEHIQIAIAFRDTDSSFAAQDAEAFEPVDEYIYFSP